MKSAMLGILASALVSPVAAQPAMTTVSVKGAGSWEMICHVSSGFADDAVILDASRPSFARADLSSASCDSSASAKGPLVVSISGPAVCPFKEAAADHCERSFKGAASFTVRAKPR